MDQDRGIRRGAWITAILLVLAAIALLDRCGRRAEAHPGHDHIPLAAEHYREQLTLEVSYYFGLVAPVSTFAGQIHQESGWREGARSRVAAGLGQFTDATAADMVKWYSTELGHVPRPLDGDWAITAMVLYMRRLYGQLREEFPGLDARWPAALASYNGGIGWALRERRKCAAQGRLAICDPSVWWLNVERFCLRSAASCEENRAYPRQILYRYAPLYKRAGW